MKIKICKCGKEFPQFSTTDSKCYKCKLDKERIKYRERMKGENGYIKVMNKKITLKQARSNYKKDPKMEEWHEAGRIRSGGRCEVCRRPFPKNMLCGDHILTRGAYPEFKYDPDNQVIVCMEDHNKRNNGIINPKTHPVYKPRFEKMLTKISYAQSSHRRGATEVSLFVREQVNASFAYATGL